MSSLQALLDAQERKGRSPGLGSRRGGGDGSRWADGGRQYTGGNNRWSNNNSRPPSSSSSSHRNEDYHNSRSDRGGNYSSRSNNNNHWETIGKGNSFREGSRSSWGTPSRNNKSSNFKSAGSTSEPTYEERRANIERRAVEDSRKLHGKASSRGWDKEESSNPNNNTQESIQSLSTWVGPLENGQCIYYQDRDKRYPFYTNEHGYNLLQQLMETNKSLLQINHQMLEEKAKSDEILHLVQEHDCDAKDVVIRIGQGLYAHKPTLRTKGVTWSTEEYSHPGLCRMYLRMKSIQRFTEVWCLLERCDELGVFDAIIQQSERGEVMGPIRFAAVGGGPGYELLATKLYFAERAPNLDLELTCMDLCPAWRPYAEQLGFNFVEYDINNDEGINPLQAMGLKPGELHFCIVSCLMIYCTNERVLDMFRKLTHEEKVNAILVSERGERTKACTIMEDLGGKVIRLIDQSEGMDERQAIWCSQEFCDEELRTSIPDYEDHQRTSVFPNVPYCEHKERKRRNGRRYGGV